MLLTSILLQRKRLLMPARIFSNINNHIALTLTLPFIAFGYTNKMLSYRRETALQGALVLGQKWKTGTGRQYLPDIIGLSSTTVTQSARKAIEFGEKTQNKGYYAIQGHSKSSRSVPIESPYATSY